MACVHGLSMRCAISLPVEGDERCEPALVPLSAPEITNCKCETILNEQAADDHEDRFYSAGASMYEGPRCLDGWTDSEGLKASGENMHTHVGASCDMWPSTSMPFLTDGRKGTDLSSTESGVSSLDVDISTSVDWSEDVPVHGIECDEKNIIRVGTGEFTDRYELGDEVMLSFQEGHKICFGTRRADGLKVVVKRNFKSQARCNGDHEWRDMTEFMLNMPKCEGIAELIEVLETTDEFFVVTELVEGKDLLETIVENGEMVVGIAREVIYQLLQAVNGFHKHGVIHKDLKLENVMIDLQALTSLAEASPAILRGSWGPTASLSRDMPRILKVIDFDTVAKYGPCPEVTTMIAGTDQYIPQEAYSGMYSPSSDLFSVGVIAYRLLTGRFPLKRSFFDQQSGDHVVGSEATKRIQHKLREAQIKWDYKVFSDNPDAMDLVKSLLANEADARPTFESAVAHRWFTAPAKCEKSTRIASCIPEIISGTVACFSGVIGTFGCGRGS
eukprot:TRINITY_DN4384_c1_g1_i1.p1 TRINITY_DN4384_c1_g1~~TRINITY_DN4384_c1_g1_i1.p1  ORF type:complete len:501 (-),score=65.11 TRINITY_DN4384_c1_g1_i1:79-1581(-)